MLDKNIINSSLLLSLTNTESQSNINVDILEGIPYTGASKHFLQPKTKSTCTKVTQLKSTATSTTAADGGKMTATHKVQIPFAKELSKIA